MRLKIAALAAALATVLGLAVCNEVSDTYPRDGWPTFATTGPSALGLDELNLPACSTLYASAPANSTGGTWYLTTANQVLQNCAFRGKQIVVQASGVTLRGMVIAGDANLHVLNDSTGLMIDARSSDPTLTAPTRARRASPARPRWPTPTTRSRYRSSRTALTP